ncbi:alpha-L-fucosidase [Aestuariibaculum sediminum]|uniref:alpha-L-fucosidase n=1 Tax=Aestuariibaculum sediminum TaxID=2770637 RepID=A0A8J6U9M4_9FLAO|nr:alpha-L-fucosidase [Aestuariibaculum sediminum]MBD0833372.1 alpha-L-fucosidase [Aestuariibaculum sediminum]
MYIIGKRLVLLLFGFSVFGQSKDLGIDQIREKFECPAWFKDAGFGIWLHWGAQTEPEIGGGWYARHMYMQDVGKETWGQKAYDYHVNKYGHPSEFGYKDVINQWKAEHLDPDYLVKYFKRIGAKYFMVLANHHDHFDNFDSSYHEWNSVNVGPKKDIVGLFREAARKNEIPFGVSSHDDRFLGWWQTAFGSDINGPMKGKPYDGYMTKNDGNGKWWEGLDPANLYGLPPEKRTPEYVEAVKENWVERHKELAIKYDVDMLWFDGYGYPYGTYGEEVVRAFYNNMLKKHGEFSGLAAGKVSNDPIMIRDIERGGANEILNEPWQGIITFGSWFYKNDTPVRHNARTILEMLADMNSKNGNLMLNVELYSDGTIPEVQKGELDEIGNWMSVNAEAIYGTEAWEIFGDNLNSIYKIKDGENIGEVDLKALEENKNKGHFNERTVDSPLYGSEEVRFTKKGNHLYVFVLNPKSGEISLPSLGTKSEFKVNKISNISMLGSAKKIKFQQGPDKLTFSIPKNRPTPYVTVFKIKGAL